MLPPPGWRRRSHDRRCQQRYAGVGASSWGLSFERYRWTRNTGAGATAISGFGSALHLPGTLRFWVAACSPQSGAPFGLGFDVCLLTWAFSVSAVAAMVR